VTAGRAASRAIHSMAAGATSTLKTTASQSFRAELGLACAPLPWPMPRIEVMTRVLQRSSSHQVITRASSISGRARSTMSSATPRAWARTSAGSSAPHRVAAGAPGESKMAAPIHA